MALEGKAEDSAGGFLCFRARSSTTARAPGLLARQHYNSTPQRRWPGSRYWPKSRKKSSRWKSGHRPETRKFPIPSECSLGEGGNNSAGVNFVSGANPGYALHRKPQSTKLGLTVARGPILLSGRCIVGETTEDCGQWKCGGPLFVGTCRETPSGFTECASCSPQAQDGVIACTGAHPGPGSATT